MDNEDLKNEKKSHTGCGCGHDSQDCNCDHQHDDDCGCCAQDTMTITFDDGETTECNIIGVFEVEDLEYIAVNPIDSDEVLLYRYTESDEEDGMNIEFIDSDEEYNKVTAVFYEILEEDGEDDYDEYVDEDDEE